MEQTLVEKELGTTVSQFNYHRVLIKAIAFPDRLASGLYMAEGYKDEKAKAYNIGKVLKIGSLCYPEADFPHGPLCKEGDWVFYSDYQRHAIYINDLLCYIIHDVSVLFPIDDIGATVPFLKQLES